MAARTPIQQIREELLGLINDYFDRAEARMRRRLVKTKPQPGPIRDQLDAATEPDFPAINESPSDPDLENFFAALPKE